MRAGNETMPKDTIQLNSDKVRLRIAVAGRPIKAYADGLSEKTSTASRRGEPRARARRTGWP